MKISTAKKSFAELTDSAVQRTVRPVVALVPDREEFFHRLFDNLLERVAGTARAIPGGGNCGQDVVGPLPGSRAESAGSRAGWGGPGRVGHKAEAGEGSLSRVSDHVEQESEAFRARRDRSLDLSRSLDPLATPRPAVLLAGQGA